MKRLIALWRESREAADAEMLRRYRDGELKLGGYFRGFTRKESHQVNMIERAALKEALAAGIPIHGRNTIPPRLPFTWYVCQNGHWDIGSPTREPRGRCWQCRHDEFTGWEPAPLDAGYRQTLLTDPSIALRTQEGLG